MQPLFVFCADLHLEDGAWSSRPGIYGDAYYSFDQIIDYCIEHKLPLIMGGDILEKKQNLARPIAKLCAGLTRMQEANVDAYYIQGNHEYDRNAPWLSVHPWPVHMHWGTFEINGVKVFGLDWLPRGTEAGGIQHALTQIPYDTDILITHQVWKDFMGNVGRIECELTEVHRVQHVLAGDFHITKTVESVNAQGQPIRMLSPGSTAMQDIGETPEKFFFVISRSADGFLFHPQPLKTRPFLKYTVETQEELDALCSGELSTAIEATVAQAKQAGIPEHIRKPLVRIKFNKHLPDAWLRLTTAIGEAAHTFCDPLVDSGTVKTSRATADTKNDVLSALETLLGADSAACKLAAAVYAADEPAKEIDVLFRRHMEKEPIDAVTQTGSSELGSSSPSDL